MTPRKLEILQVIPTYYPAVRYGGPIRSVHALSAALAERGHRVDVVTTNVDGPHDSDVPLGKPVLMDGVRVYYFPVPALRRLYWSPAMAAHLRATMHGYDIVHLHSVFLWPTWAAARIARLHRVPYLVAPRGQLVRELIVQKNRWLKSAWITCIERRNIARAAALQVTTAIEARDVAQLNLPLPPVVCVANGVHWPAAHEPLSTDQLPQLAQPYALYLGRLVWKKGLERLIRAWPAVAGLSLVIAGVDDEGYRAKLETLAGDLQLAGRVHFIGPLSDERKWAVYESAEMFILPSFSENFGNVVAEAMSMSCPVIVTAGVGLAPLVEETGAGLVTDGAPENLARAVNTLHADPALRARMGAAGRRAAEERLSWSGVAAQLESIYANVTAGRLTLQPAS